LCASDYIKCINQVIGSIGHSSGGVDMKKRDLQIRMRVLFYLWSTMNGATVSDLCKALGERVTVQHIGWLEKNEYVKRVVDVEDTRKINIYLTSKARPVCKELVIGGFEK
jgi:hypothetical protein